MNVRDRCESAETAEGCGDLEGMRDIVQRQRSKAVASRTRLLWFKDCEKRESRSPRNRWNHQRKGRDGTNRDRTCAEQLRCRTCHSGPTQKTSE